MTVSPGFVNTLMAEGMDLRTKLTVEPEEVAKKIAAAVLTGQNVLYVQSIGVR